MATFYLLEYLKHPIVFDAMIAPFRTIADLWSRLPAFRAVAETEHLPTAADRMSVSASALSRSVSLLEEELGQALFQRSGRRIELNSTGERFLAAVRDAMRLIHEAVNEARGQSMVGPIQVSSAPPWSAMLVLPELIKLHREHNRLIAHHRLFPESEINMGLLRGDLDIAFVEHPVRHPRLMVTEVACMKRGIYAAEEHPLAKVRSVSPTDLAEHLFVTTWPDPARKTVDGWPEHLPRQVGMVVQHDDQALEVCEKGGMLSVLLDFAAMGRRLVRLPIDIVAPARLFALHRPMLSSEEQAPTGGIPLAVSTIKARVEDRYTKDIPSTVKMP